MIQRVRLSSPSRENNDSQFYGKVLNGIEQEWNVGVTPESLLKWIVYFLQPALADSGQSSAIFSTLAIPGMFEPGRGECCAFFWDLLNLLFGLLTVFRSGSAIFSRRPFPILGSPLPFSPLYKCPVCSSPEGGNTVHVLGDLLNLLSGLLTALPANKG